MSRAKKAREEEKEIGEKMRAFIISFVLFRNWAEIFMVIVRFKEF
jgi:hypothetical protein